MPALLAEKDGHVLTVTINRPEKKNAVNAEVLCGLDDAWHRLDEDDELRVAILTGAGDSFCAGMDLGVINKLTAGKPPEDEFEERLANDMSVIFDGWLKTYRPSKPVIAAVEGYALAGGGPRSSRAPTSAWRPRAPSSASPKCSEGSSRWRARRCGCPARSRTPWRSRCF
jgi:enoyl-CoA hydratase/carnithine racemase